MKFKKNDKIRMVKCYYNAKVGMTGEIRGFSKEHMEYIVFFPKMYNGGYGNTCNGAIPEGGGHYIPEDCMELLMTFPQKLEKFKTERVGFHVDTKEIADELQKVFDKEELVMHGGVMRRAWKTYGAEGGLYVSYNYFGAPGLGYGMYKGSGKNLNEILPITLEELKEYNSTLAITITSDGYHRVTAESNGKTAEALCNPTDTFDVAEGAKLAIQRLLKEPKFHKGDLVEVIGDGMLTKGAIGLQGVVMENDDAPFVTLVTRVNHSDCWSFKQENLRLIRRANV